MNGIAQTYQGKPLVHAWTYYDFNGVPVGYIGRYQEGQEKKDIVPFFKKNGSSWMAGIELNPRPLFGLELLKSHSKEKTVFIVEGEKSAAALQQIGVTALTSLGGSQAALKADWLPLSGYKAVYLLPDNDEAGEKYIQDIYRALIDLPEPPIIKILRLSGLPDKGDVVDWLQSWVDDWDGYSPIPESLHNGLKEELKEELKNAESIPNEWALDTLGTLDTGGLWQKPNKIESETSPVKALEDRLIPEPFKLWLTDESYRMQAPKDFSVATAIVIIGSLIGSGCSIRPKRLDDWEVIPNVWGACIGTPTTMKSPSMNVAKSPLERLQAEYGEQYEADKAGAEFNSLTNKAMLDDLKTQLTKAAKGKGKDGVVQGDEIQKLKADYMELSENTEPEATRRLFKTNETSVQSMTLLQVQNERGILVFRDELTGLLAKWDTEQGSDERAYFLEGWNGDGSYTDVKIGRGLTEAPNICISLIGGIQPDKLARYQYQANKGNNDGLVQRLQLAVWPDEMKDWQLVDTKPNKAEKQRAFDIMKALAELDFTQYGAIKGEHDKRPFFRFDEAGQAIFNDWVTELQKVKIKEEENPLMCEHFGKYRSLMPSLALIFHCIDIADGKIKGSVTGKSAQLAVDWCKYLESHARRIYAMAASPEHEAAVRLSEKIKTKCLPSPFTAKDIYRKHWHGLTDKSEIEAACNILIEENWLMMQRKPKPLTGRPPLPEYSINPFFL